MRIRLVLAALVAALSVLVLGTPVQAARPAVRVLTFNICGNVCRHGEVTGTTGFLAYRIRSLNASVTMLQEICYSQFLGVRTRLARFGYSAAFAAATNGSHCDDHDRKHGRGFGVALLARGPMVGLVAHRLPSPYGMREEGRVVLGATVRVAGRSIFAVTTHTAVGGPDLAVQMGALHRWLAPMAANGPVLFGGDLNSLPASPDLDGFYTAFREADSDRDNPMPTFIPAPRKIDYIFGSLGWFVPGGASRTRTSYSDHYMYVGVFA
jgi:endonuclease/exonuclease/phosphatase family metal-dependent hydrolase